MPHMQKRCFNRGWLSKYAHSTHSLNCNTKVQQRAHSRTGLLEQPYLVHVFLYTWSPQISVKKVTNRYGKAMMPLGTRTFWTRLFSLGFDVFASLGVPLYIYYAFLLPTNLPLPGLVIA